MRLATTTLLIALFALLMTVPASLAHAPSGQADQSYPASLAGYAPPVVALASGEHLAWSSVDVAHTFTEGTGSAVDEPCTDVTFSTVSTTGATFLLGDGGGQLEAQPDGTDKTNTCASATQLSNAAAMGFFCTFHPWMNGLLVVYDAGATTAAEVMTDPTVLLQRDALAAGVA